MPLDECVVFPDGAEFSPFRVDLRRQGHTQAQLCTCQIFNRIPNEPYDVFGAWLSRDVLISGSSRPRAGVQRVPVGTAGLVRLCARGATRRRHQTVQRLSRRKRARQLRSNGHDRSAQIAEPGRNATHIHSRQLKLHAAPNRHQNPQRQQNA